MLGGPFTPIYEENIGPQLLPLRQYAAFRGNSLVFA